MVIEHACSFVETPRVPRVHKPELLEIQMMAKFMAESAQQCAEGGDLFAHCCPHPHTNQHGVGRVVAEKLECPMLTGAQKSRRQYANATGRHFIEI